MLTGVFKINRSTISIFLPLLLCCLLVGFSFTRLFAAHNYKFSVGITFDLVFTVPVLHILLSRGRNYLKYTGALFFTAGLLIAGFIVPKDNQYWLHEIKIWIIPVVEICAIVFFIATTRNVLSSYRLNENARVDFYSTLKAVTGELLPKKLATIVSAEISAFYYGFFSWRKQVFNEQRFSYHKKTSVVLLIGVFIFLILVETTVFHILLNKWSTKAAWVLSITSLYAVLQAFGIARSICKRPIEILHGKLIIPYGILAETVIDVNDILSVERVDKYVAGEGSVCISPFAKIEEPDVVIKLTKTCIINGIYGSKKSSETLFMKIDEREEFLRQMEFLTGSTVLRKKTQKKANNFKSQ